MKTARHECQALPLTYMKLTCSQQSYFAWLAQVIDLCFFLLQLVHSHLTFQDHFVILFVVVDRRRHTLSTLRLVSVSQISGLHTSPDHPLVVLTKEISKVYHIMSPLFQ